MKSNPGGQIAVSDILGRDALIASLWEILEQQSVIMTAERRIGKTSVIRKMQAQPAANWVPVLQDLERIHSTSEFAGAVYEEIQHHLGRWRKVANKAKKFLDSIGGAEIGGILKLPGTKDKHWKTLLVHAVADLVEQQDPNRLVFFWDEMPYMLGNISKREGEEAAMEVLDVLRALRHDAPGFRMVLTGSIGLHHVLGKLKAADYKNEPVNDMYRVEVKPLESADARDLARRLLNGEQLKATDLEKSAETIAQEGDAFPFYIHHIVRHLRLCQRNATPEEIRKAVTEQLVDANDPWELRHYRVRIPDYYPQEEELVTVILDTVAAADLPMTVNSVLAAVTSQMAFDNRNRLLQVLKLLEQDHYLIRSPEGLYSFRFPLIRRWWRLDRGL